MFIVTTEADPETGLPGVPALLATLDEPATHIRALHVLALGGDDGDEPVALGPDTLRPARVAAALMVSSSRAGGRLFRVSSATFAIVTGDQDREVGLRHDAQIELERAAPASGRRLRHGRAVIPIGGRGGRPVLQEAFAAMRGADAWQPQSAARQASDVLVQLLYERHLAGRRPRRARIAASTVAVGRELGLTPVDLHEIVRAAELQDVGLLTLPETLLQERGSLDDAQWRLVRRHPVAGERIVAAATALTGVARLVRSCYERYDGTGYPDGLVGDEIPLGARIIAVCVAYDAMVVGRPYRAARPPHLAVAELRACAGRQFDPRVVAAFHRGVEEP